MFRLTAAVALGIAVLPARAAELAISCGALGQELELCREGAERWSAATGHSVQIVPTPNSSTERLALYQQLLSAGSPDIDVFQVDIVWPGILGEHFIDLAPHAGGATEAHFPAIVEANTVGGELKAMPFWTDAGVLYYRADLLEKHGRPVPLTWSEMEATAEAIQEAERAAGTGGMWGYVFQGKAYEGLTCNALEWIASYGGGTVVADDGRITVNNPQALEALSEAASWIATIAPPGVLNYSEEEARGVFQSGNAVFMRNWPYAWALAQSEDSPVRGKVAVTVLPRGGEDGRNAGTLGGWNLAVSRYSDEPELAADLVMFLTSQAEQKIRAIRSSYNPTYPALYRDPEVLEAVPYLATLYENFVTAVARPSRATGESYSRVSAAFWEAAHDVLSGEAGPEEALATLEAEIEAIRRRGR